MIKEVAATWKRPEGVPKNWSQKFYEAYVKAELASKSANKVTDYVVNRGKNDPNKWHAIDNAKRLHKEAETLHKTAAAIAPDPKIKKFHQTRALYHSGYVTGHPGT